MINTPFSVQNELYIHGFYVSTPDSLFSQSVSAYLSLARSISLFLAFSYISILFSKADSCQAHIEIRDMFLYN